ncbi:S1C family serine protease [Treponema sp.]|uniref:S1C family serine protease n=1 Tax=Treponema sp. TaxID=166 RepID=UPI00298E2482|nr:trypsin-like peptidase domain-containing protein [Treponema sp.]
MRLYSRKQALIYCAISGIIVGAISAACTVFFLGNGTQSSPKQQTELKEASVVPSESSSMGKTDAFDLEAETPSVNVANDSPNYTQDELQNISVYEKCNEAVVNITTQTMGYNWFLEPVITGSGSGSGSIIDKRGYVVTNCHVIEDATTINISLADGTSYEGHVIGKDIESDIAVIKFDPDPKAELKTIDFGNSDALKVGQKVIAIGNPFALERTMTTGIISGLGRPIQSSNNVIIRNMIQTDAAINPGNSGGPLLDSKGHMIGINTIIYSKSGSSSGVGFAIPVSTARRVVRDLLAFGRVNRGTIQASFVQNTGRIAAYAGYKISTGLLVNKVRSGSKAAQGGLKGGTKAVQYGTFNPQTIYLGGDIITEVNGIKIDRLADFYSALEDKKPGDKINITVYRDGHIIGLTIELEN